MSLNSGAKNTSLSLPYQEECLKPDVVPARNAVSSIKRSKESGRIGRLSFKPIRLTNLSQEWREAENEPLKEVSSFEEIADNEAGDQSYDKESIEVLENVLSDLCIQSGKKENKNPKNEHVSSDNGMDLGVNWLQTPAKTQPRVKYDEGICAITPKINCSAKLSVSTPSTAVIQEFVTPYNVKTIQNDKSSVSKPKIQYSMDVRGLLRTPMNNFDLIKKKRSQSLTTPYTRQNPSLFKNTSSEGEGINTKETHTGLKSSIKNPNSILHEKNKENAPKSLNNKVQFSLPATEFPDNKDLNEIRVKNVTYIISNELGRGGSSVVYHCYDPKTKSECAIKKVNLGSDQSAAGYINEVKVLERLQTCDRIVKMFDYEHIESEKLLLVVLERGDLDLSKILKNLSNTNKHLPMNKLMFYWTEMLYAVKQIHEHGIIHSDLKPANFLSAKGGLKLIDFGIASCVQDDMTSVVKHVQIGSFSYISPEALTNAPSNNCDSPSFGKPKFKVSYKSDVWSLGCILYQLVYRKTPFQYIGHMWAKLSAIMDPKHKIDYPEADWVPSRIVNTIKKCLQHEIKARPSIDELIEEYENIYN